MKELYNILTKSADSTGLPIINSSQFVSLTEKYGKELSDMKIIGLDLIRRGYDPNSVQYKTVLLQELSLKLLETIDQTKTDSLRREIEFIQKELDKIR